MVPTYDALLILSFGGPECRDDVLPFLENVVRGKRVPRERLLEVAEHYYHFDGVSPINAQNRALIGALQQEFSRHHLDMPIYWGNRNWHPLLPDTVQKMKEDGVRQALAFVTSVFGSYSGCRQYLEDLERARAHVGPDAPTIHKIRSGFNHPGFIGAVADRLHVALDQVPEETRQDARLVFSAHSIPLSMAATCPYVAQLEEACRLVAEAAHFPEWKLVYQSRSGPPNQPWLEPDVCHHLTTLASEGSAKQVLLVPIGFTSDHMEVLYDLDTEARQVCDAVGLGMTRVETVGTHGDFVEMIRELVQERIVESPQRRSLGTMGPRPDHCAENCCPPPTRP